MSRFYVIGLDDNPEQHFTPEVMELISSGYVFSGGKRHYEIVSSLLPVSVQWIDITVPLDRVFEQYTLYEEIIVFASGDPLFYGFANTIQKRLPDADIKVYPVFNSLQTLAHRLAMPYQDMRIVSLTGRPWHKFDRALIERTIQIGVLTDREHTPVTIAERMIEYGYSHYTLFIGEHLGNPSKEKIYRLKPGEVKRQEFGFPNCLILLEGDKPLIARPYGIPDAEFEHLNGREKMITKMPVRLLTLQMLGLPECRYFWDIGFCTGSVSIEARLQFPHLHVTAFEIREEGYELIETNSKRFGTPGIQVFIGDFCETDLSGLESPEAVFIGGHGGKLKEIVRKVKEKLAPGGVIVFNSVSEESLELFRDAIAEIKMKIDREMVVTIDNYNTITICRTILRHTEYTENTEEHGFIV